MTEVMMVMAAMKKIGALWRVGFHADVENFS